MNCFEVVGGTVLEGIALENGEVVLGEVGRGRQQTRVPLPAGARVEGGRFVGVPARSSDEVVVCIRDHSGFRGGWRLRVQLPDGSWEEFYNLEPEALPIRVIAEGWCAQGTAGRMGGGPEYLLALREGQEVEVVRWGRLYGAPEVVRLRVEGGRVVATDPEAEARRQAAGAALAALAEEEDGHDR